MRLQYFQEAVPVDVTLYDRDGQLVDRVSCQAGEELRLKISKPVLWNTEDPYLYTLVLGTAAEVIVDHVGLRRIEVRDYVVCLNGKPIIFRGVNRHDSDPVTGPVASVEQMMEDLTLMRRHNINAIRASHYPNAPVFLQFCDRYGFMVIDEADIESHGPVEIYHRDNSDEHKFEQWNVPIADNPLWEEPIMNRVRQFRSGICRKKVRIGSIKNKRGPMQNAGGRDPFQVLHRPICVYAIYFFSTSRTAPGPAISSRNSASI